MNESNTSSTQLDFPTPFAKKAEGGPPNGGGLVPGGKAYLDVDKYQASLVGPDPDKPGNWIILYRDDWNHICRTSIEATFLKTDEPEKKEKDVPRM